MSNRSLNNAKAAKQDEFYTQLTDIEKELQYYWSHFSGKKVLCNCDDPYESNFFKYFALRFNQLGLKKLTCTCYNGSPVMGKELPLFALDVDGEEKKVAYKVEITEVSDSNGDGAIDLADVEYLIQNDKNVLSSLQGNGDFRSKECIELLKEADIVVTNPPFSLFREFVDTLIKYEKQFLIMGNDYAISNKNIFPLLFSGQIWNGINSGHTWFEVPEYYEIPDFYDLTDTKKLRSNGYAIKDGRLWRNLGNICWFTNLDHRKRHEYLDLIRNTKLTEYQEYDNYKAIEVGNVNEIPCDYKGVIGVPITYMHKYNPDQFELLGITENDPKMKEYWKDGAAKYDRPYLNGQRKSPRLLIRNKNPQQI